MIAEPVYLQYGTLGFDLSQILSLSIKKDYSPCFTID